MSMAQDAAFRQWRQRTKVEDTAAVREAFFTGCAVGAAEERSRWGSVAKAIVELIRRSPAPEHVS